MKLSSWLSFIAAVFFVTPLAAQQNLPKSTQEHFAASARVEALTLGDLKTVLSKAQSGDCEPQYLLGLIYERGLLVPRDFSATKSWMLKSAEQGYVPAQEAMGEMYLINVRDNGPIRDYGDADRWLRLAATQGNADAQFWLGTGYERGWFGTIDYREALKWLRKAADQGLPNAQLSLGQMYEDGEGVRESDSLAASWYRKAADHFSGVGGVWEAEVQLAYLYRDGRLGKDYTQAYMWFAIVSSSAVPPDDYDVKQAARHMTKAQITQAQRMAADWIKRHTAKPVDLVQAKR
jgi:TPR repeat protein